MYQFYLPWNHQNNSFFVKCYLFIKQIYRKFELDSNKRHWVCFKDFKRCLYNNEVLACILKIPLQRVFLALDEKTYHACIESPEIEFRHRLNTFHIHDDKVCWYESIHTSLKNSIQIHLSYILKINNSTIFLIIKIKKFRTRTFNDDVFNWDH